MNRQAKSAIEKLVLELRHRLEDDIAIQLKRYGFAGERWLPPFGVEQSRMSVVQLE